jgi:hypothetical protein
MPPRSTGEPVERDFRIVARRSDKRIKLDGTLGRIKEIQAFVRILQPIQPEYKGDALATNYFNSLH